MSINSSNFGANNQILFRTKIVHSRFDSDYIGKCIDLEPERCQFKDADVIDINHNQKGDTRLEFGILQSDGFFTEPVMDTPMSEVTEKAAQQGKEIVTREDVGDLKVKDQGFIVSEGFYTKVDEFEGRKRSLDNVVHELAPKEDNAKWAIDTGTQEFLIYKPRD